MFQHLHSIPRLPPALIGQGVRLFGLNLLHRHPADMQQHYVTVLFITKELRPEAPGAALLVKLRFRQPMAPLLNPDHALWNEHIEPHVEEALRIVKQPQLTVSLVGVLVQATTLVHTKPQVISGGGCIVLPKLPPPGVMAVGERQPHSPKPPKFGCGEPEAWRWAA